MEVRNITDDTILNECFTFLQDDDHERFFSALLPELSETYSPRSSASSSGSAPSVAASPEYAGSAECSDSSLDQSEFGPKLKGAPTHDTSIGFVTGFASLPFLSSQNRDDDSAIGLLEIHHGVNLGSFLDELFRLHFKNIHPYYPVIDEFMFEENFSFAIPNEQKRKDRAVALCAVLLCASMYLVRGRIYAGIWTQPALQQKIYSALKDLYQPDSTSDHIYLTQACFLLSYWSPSYQEHTHDIHKWIESAFQHAKEAGIDQITSEVLTDRSRLTWACCVVRDRVVSFSSRRPLRKLSTRANWMGVTREDFGLEICMPRYTCADTRNHLVDAFLLLCRLSEILADIMEYEHKQKLRYQNKPYRLGTREILHVSQFDVRLREWKRGFRNWKAGPRIGTIVDSRGAYYLRSIVAESATASLYLPYIRQTNAQDPLLSNFAALSLQKVKDSAAVVADCVREMLSTVSIEEIPPFMAIWLPLPLTILLVVHKFEQLAALRLSRSSTNAPMNGIPVANATPGTIPYYEPTTLSRLRYLYAALDVFSARFPGDVEYGELCEKAARGLGLCMPGLKIQDLPAAKKNLKSEKERDVMFKAAQMTCAALSRP